MKKQLRKALAIICAIAFAVTGITFTPSSVEAAQANQCVIGTWTHAGVWDYDVIQNEWKNEKASYNDASKIEGFIYSHDVYGWDGAWWKASDLKDIYGLTAGSSYECEVVIKPLCTTATNIHVRTDGGTENLPNEDKSGTSSANLTWTGTVTPSADPLILEIGYGNMSDGTSAGAQVGGFQIISVTFTGDGFEKVPENEDFVPSKEVSGETKYSPWTLKVQYEPKYDEATDTWSGTFGDMSYKVDGDITDVASTKVRVNTPAHDDASEDVDQQDPTAWWWWNSGFIENYADASSFGEGKSYQGTVNFKYTAPDPATGYTPQVRMICNSVVTTTKLTEGNNELPIEAFDYSGSLPKIEFNFDLIEKGGIVEVTSVDFEQVGGDWVRVPDNDEAGATVPVAYDSSMMHTGVVIHNWNVFAGLWGGEGAALYYMNDLEDPRDPLSVKIGTGNRWDPACAQIKLTNEDAYQELEGLTNYYMTYTFTSTQKGTVHINQEGYDPEGLERVDITDDDYNAEDGLYHVTYKKIFTVLPDNPGNLTMFLTPTTYKWDAEQQKTIVVEDGTALPQNTILSDFTIKYSRQDEDYWTLVTDSRKGEGVQIYDDIVKDKDDNPMLSAYSNSYNKGMMSYKPNYYADGEDDTAKMGIRLDKTAASQIDDYSFDNSWGLNLRIPNSVFYNRTDTNGEELDPEGRTTYLLRFYYNVKLPEGVTMADDKGLILVQQDYRSDDWTRYTGVKNGLNMAGGTVTQKSGYTTHDNYDKSGGIEFTYNPNAVEDDRYVQFDFSEFPEGTIISDISYEFYVPGYNVYIDDVQNNEYPITQNGEYTTYTFPDNTVQGFENVVRYVDPDDASKVFTPGQTITFDEFNGADINVDTVRSYVVKIDGNKNADVEQGKNYTFPTATGDFANVKKFRDVNDPTKEYDPGETIGPVNSDLDFESVLKDTYTVEIRKGDPNGELLKTTDVNEDEQYELPTLPGIVNYTYNGQDYNAGNKIGPFTGTVVVVANPAQTHTVKIVNAEDPDDVIRTVDNIPDGGDYTLPTDIEDIKVYVMPNGEEKDPGDKIENITQDITVEAVFYEYYKITIDGVKVADVKEGGNYTFPSGPDAAKIGYISKDGGDDVYAPGSTIGPIDQDKDFLSIDEIEVKELQGAAIWLNNKDANNKRGIAFGAYFSIKNQKGAVISATQYASVYKSKAFHLGMLLTTHDLYEEYFDGEIDLAAAARAMADGHPEYIHIVMNDNNFYEMSGDGAEFRAGIIRLNDYNIPRDFISRAFGYVETTDGNLTDVVYADVSDVRSIQTVATNIMKDPAWRDHYKDWEQEIIEYCKNY